MTLNHSAIRGLCGVVCAWDSSFSVYNPGHSLLDRWLLTSAQTPNLWVPVCCERVMRYNMFFQQDGLATVHWSAPSATRTSRSNSNIKPTCRAYGEGSRVLSMLGSPKPPMYAAPKPAGDSALNDKTL